jgi:hypothetical protein
VIDRTDAIETTAAVRISGDVTDADLQVPDDRGTVVTLPGTPSTSTTSTTVSTSS